MKPIKAEYKTVLRLNKVSMKTIIGVQFLYFGFAALGRRADHPSKYYCGRKSEVYATYGFAS